MELPTRYKRIRIFGNNVSPHDAARCLAHPENIEWCRWIADSLDIEADGGDDPAEVVRYAFESMVREWKVKSAQHRLDAAKEWRY